MKNRILLAMSTLPAAGRLSEKKFEISFTDGEKSIVDNCIGQLEPSVKYILNKYKEHELEIDILCTDSTLIDKQIINGKEYTAVNYFIERILENKEENAEVEINNDELVDNCIIEKKVGKVSFVIIKIDENKPKSGIENTVNWIRENQDIDGKFWIDTHGGFRDISLICSAIVSLLKEDGIVPDSTLSVRYNEEKSESQKIAPSVATIMFDFVAAMNEFIQFGSADSLSDIYKNSDNDSIKRVIEAMKTISDGTRLCDPNLYLEGLEQLENTIDKVENEDDYFTIFIDNVKRDYGDLLDSNKRTPLKIIERCQNKKLYQQALTFIESLMPEVYVKQHKLYYDNQDADTVIDGQRSANKGFETTEHFFFDQVTGGMEYYSENYANNIWNKFVKSTGKSKDDVKNEIISKKDYLALECIRNCNNRAQLESYLLPIHDGKTEAPMKKIKNKSVFTNYVSVKTSIHDNNLKKQAAHLFRIHNAIKRCRNMVNHSSQKMRPSMSELDEAIKVYVQLAKNVLGE